MRTQMSQATNQAIAKSVQINRHAAADPLVVKQDREPPLVVLPWSTWRRICEALRRD